MMSPLRQIQLTLEVASGGQVNDQAGSVTTDIEYRGWLIAVHLQLPANAAPTSDFQVDIGEPALRALNLTDHDESGWHYPMRTAQFGSLPIMGKLTFSAGQCNSGIYVATIVYQELPF